MSPAVVVEKEPVPAAEKSAPKTVAATAASKAEKRKVPPTEAAPSVAAKKAVPSTVTTPPAATEPAKQVATFCCPHIRCIFYSIR